MGAPHFEGGLVPPAVWLTAPSSGWRVWFQLDVGSNQWYQRWYHSRSAAKAARTRMRICGAVIVGADGTVI